ncbi:UPF0149 family protein [Sphingomonas folli]|uniref:UPF0149 family protein n=1 Tax=Sphingomonas folli TaxID=2862497 RepID=UPI0021564A63|nr:UPF0149 family protein [Sphingomonas folli]
MRPPSRFRRLDGALADLPVEQPMLLTELDGFLTGLLVSPQAAPPNEWMEIIWGPETEGVPPFEDPLDVQWFASAIAARMSEIARDLARGKFQPILDLDERDRELLWEDWIGGFAEAVALRPDAWSALANDDSLSQPWSRLETLIKVARNESDLDSVEVNALQDHVVSDLTDAVLRLYPMSDRSLAASTIAPSTMMAAKIGRNDPCPCGSGRKHKRCCA